MLREALTYPFRGENAEEALLVGVALAVAAGLLLRLGLLAIFAVVPAVLLAGYALAVLRESAEGGDSLPRFSDFRTRAVDGMRVLVVAVGYLLVPAVALALTVGGAAPGARPATIGTTTFVLGAGTVVLFVRWRSRTSSLRRWSASLGPATCVRRSIVTACAEPRPTVDTSSGGPRRWSSAASRVSCSAYSPHSAASVRWLHSRSASTRSSWPRGWWAGAYASDFRQPSSMLKSDGGLLCQRPMADSTTDAR